MQHRRDCPLHCRCQTLRKGLRMQRSLKWFWDWRQTVGAISRDVVNYVRKTHHMTGMLCVQKNRYLGTSKQPSGACRSATSTHFHVCLLLLLRPAVLKHPETGYLHLHQRGCPRLGLKNAATWSVKPSRPSLCRPLQDSKVVQESCMIHMFSPLSTCSKAIEGTACRCTTKQVCPWGRRACTPEKKEENVGKFRRFKEWSNNIFS